MFPGRKRPRRGEKVEGGERRGKEDGNFYTVGIVKRGRWSHGERGTRQEWEGTFHASFLLATLKNTRL